MVLPPHIHGHCITTISMINYFSFYHHAHFQTMQCFHGRFKCAQLSSSCGLRLGDLSFLIGSIQRKIRLRLYSESLGTVRNLCKGVRETLTAILRMTPHYLCLFQLRSKKMLNPPSTKSATTSINDDYYNRKNKLLWSLPLNSI